MIFKVGEPEGNKMPVSPGVPLANISKVVMTYMIQNSQNRFLTHVVFTYFICWRQRKERENLLHLLFHVLNALKRKWGTHSGFSHFGGKVSMIWPITCCFPECVLIGSWNQEQSWNWNWSLLKWGVCVCVLTRSLIARSNIWPLWYLMAYYCCWRLEKGKFISSWRSQPKSQVVLYGLAS